MILLQKSMKMYYTGEKSKNGLLMWLGKHLPEIHIRENDAKQAAAKPADGASLPPPKHAPEIHIRENDAKQAAAKPADAASLPPSCADQNKNCKSWARGNQCTANEAYMRVQCRASCGFCEERGAAQPAVSTPSVAQAHLPAVIQQAAATKPSEASMHQAFGNIDTDGSGAISEKELTTLLPSLPGNKVAAADEAVAFIRDFDHDGDGQLQFEEYITWKHPEVANARHAAVAANNPSGAAKQAVRDA